MSARSHRDADRSSSGAGGAPICRLVEQLRHRVLVHGARAIMQAQALVKAVLAMHNLGTADSGRDGGTRDLADKENAVVFSRAIDNLWMNSDAAKEMSCKARDWGTGIWR